MSSTALEQQSPEGRGGEGREGEGDLTRLAGKSISFSDPEGGATSSFQSQVRQTVIQSS
jgi:hypothetical protein